MKINARPVSRLPGLTVTSCSPIEAILPRGFPILRNGDAWLDQPRSTLVLTVLQLVGTSTGNEVASQ